MPIFLDRHEMPGLTAKKSLTGTAKTSKSGANTA